MTSTLKVVAITVYLLFQFICLVGSQILLAEIFSSKRTTDANVWFTNILILLTLPELGIFLYDIWMSNIIAHKRYSQWPDVKILINGSILFVVDAIVLGILATQVFPNLPPFLLPCISCLGVSLLHPSEINHQDISSRCNGRKYIVPTAQLLLIIGISVLLMLSKILSIECAFLFGISFLIINCIRFTPLQNHIYSNSLIPAQNAELLYRFVRLITMIATVLISFIHEKDNQESFLSFADITVEPLFLMTIVVSFFALLLQTETFIQKHRIRTALLSSFSCFCATLACFILALYIWVQKFDFGGVFKSIKEFPVSFSTYHIVLYSFICISVILFYFTTFYDIQEENFALKNIFVTFYDNILPCPNLVRNIFSKGGYSNKYNKKVTRIFICTTMYQESAYEMSRLLRSLKKISSSKSIRKRNIHTESHIFLDNGAKGRDVKEFGIQLLSLVEKTFEMEEQYGIMIHTPYGIKFSWNVPGEMPLFLHLKDVSLVKAKKRWSQVMYMRYILQYRAKFQRLCQKAENPLDYNISDLIDVNVETDIVDSEVNTSNGIVPLVTFDTSSKASSFSDLTTVTNIEEAENKKKESQRIYETIENDFVNNDTQELTLRVPRLHFNSKNRRSSFDHSFISLGNLPNRSQSFDLDLQENELPYNISGSKIRSSSFNDIEFEYHKYKRKELIQQNNETLEDEQYQDFILATDADMAFDAQSVLNLLDTIESDDKTGGVCGRTFPIGIHRHPIVWLQIFDYAKDFWMIKSAQNIIGSVMCCPGCFSLYRFEAIDDVLDKFSEPTKSMSDVFTKDNGEDRWMCTLMMKAGWSLKYSFHGKNTTFCPEETEEFMKQRRRWLLSDFANAAVVAGNLLHLMKNNAAFTLVYTLYLIQLFIIMLLYPGSTIVMLALGFELVTSCPLIVNAAFLSVVCLVYCLIQISSWNAYRKLIVNKVLILVLGLLTTYVFIATSVFIVEMVLKDIIHGEMTAHIANLVLIGVIVVYLYSSLLHPTELHLLSTGIVYLFYLPLLNILLPLYAVCNIVDQTWGTRDDQKATVPRILRLPKFKKRNKRTSLKFRSNSYESLSSSAMDLQNISEDETLFWQTLVSESIGVDVNTGLSTEERTQGLRPLRNKVLVGYLILNLFWVALLTGFYAFLTIFFTDKLVYGVIVLCLLGVSAVIQLLGMTVYRVSDFLTRFGRQLL